MFVLSRKKNESIVINDDIIITVLQTRMDKVRLGIIAPKAIPVHRLEVYEAIHGKSSGASAAQPAPPPVSAAAHVPADALTQYARWILGIPGYPNPTPESLTHLQRCAECRQFLCSATTAVPV